MEGETLEALHVILTQDFLEGHDGEKAREKKDTRPGENGSHKKFAPQH
jgi:hypothetical protein